MQCLMQEAGLEVDVKYMNTLIEAMGCNGDLRSALAALEDLRSAGLAPDAGTAEAAVRACLACGDISRARAMYRDFAEVRPGLHHPRTRLRLSRRSAPVHITRLPAHGLSA